MEEQQKNEPERKLIPLNRSGQNQYEAGDNPNRYLRIWGVIDSVTGEKELRVTCRRCGYFGTYRNQAEVDAFKAFHVDANGFCKFEKKVVY